MIYYNTSGGQMTTSGKMRVLDKGVGWVMAELPITVHGKNVGMAADSLGNVIMTGINVVPDPRPAVAAVMLAN